MPRFTDLTLVVADKPDPERDAVAAAWTADGGETLRLGRFWDPPPDLDPARVRVYGNDTFCLVLAQRLGLTLASPPDDFLLRVGHSLLGRHLRGLRLDQVHELDYPVFAKSAAPKLFRSGVYASAGELREATRGLAGDSLVVASEIVIFDAEVRCWLLDGVVVTLAAYEGYADLDTARAFAQHVASHPALPAAVVLDVGPIHGRGWALVEPNAAWGAGLNGCSAAEAACCIERASRPG